MNPSSFKLKQVVFCLHGSLTGVIQVHQDPKHLRQKTSGHSARQLAPQEPSRTSPTDSRPSRPRTWRPTFGDVPGTTTAGREKGPPVPPRREQSRETPRKKPRNHERFPPSECRPPLSLCLRFVSPALLSAQLGVMRAATRAWRKSQRAGSAHLVDAGRTTTCGRPQRGTRRITERLGRKWGLPASANIRNRRTLVSELPRDGCAEN